MQQRLPSYTKTMKFCAFIIMLCPLLAFAAESDVCEKNAQFAQQFDLKINECVNVSDELQIRFVRVVEDSRCPPKAQCIWAGNAKIILTVQAKDSEQKELELNTNGDSNELPSEAEYSKNLIKLINLGRSSKNENKVSPDQQIATLVVKKK